MFLNSIVCMSKHKFDNLIFKSIERSIWDLYGSIDYKLVNVILQKLNIDKNKLDMQTIEFKNIEALIKIKTTRIHGKNLKEKIRNVLNILKFGNYIIDNMAIEDFIVKFEKGD